MKISEMARLFNDRIDMHERELWGYDRADEIAPEHVRYYAATYKAEVERLFKVLVPDPGSENEINADRLKLIAWRQNETAWNKIDTSQHSGFGSLSGYVRARAIAAAHREIAFNFWRMSEGTWLPDMSGRIPNR
jgi:hypothetical protein